MKTIVMLSALIGSSSRESFRREYLFATNRIIVLFLILFLYSCNLLDTIDEKEPGKNGDLTAAFILSDTTGKETATFQTGEEFLMIFDLQNTSNDTITYVTPGYGEPPVALQILREGKVVSTSKDGYTYPAIPGWGSIVPGDTLRIEWKAPNTPVRVPQIILTPGLYEARVLLARFSVKINTDSPVIFEIIE